MAPTTEMGSVAAGRQGALISAIGVGSTVSPKRSLRVRADSIKRQTIQHLACSTPTAHTNIDPHDEVAGPPKSATPYQ